MITARISSGLGNQMFQYAAAFALSRRLGTELQMDTFLMYRNCGCTPRNFELDAFCIQFQKRLRHRHFLSNKFLRNMANFTYKIFYKKKWYLEEHFYYLYDSRIENAGKNCYLAGFFQSEKYFANCKDDVRKEFQFKKNLCGQNEKLMEKLQEQNTVALHIRRGDYVKERNIKLGLVCTPFYYENAIEYIQKHIPNLVFLIFSEDLEWVRANIKIPQPCHFIDWNLALPPSIDMQLMSLCKHQIISNSSYSWWASWLNNNPSKIIVAPDKWRTDVEETDIYTENMVKIPTTLMKEKI